MAYSLQDFKNKHTVLVLCVENFICDGKSLKSSFALFSPSFFATMSHHRLMRSASEGTNFSHCSVKFNAI